MDFKKYIRAGKGAADITPLLQDREAFGALINEFGSLANGLDIDEVVCIEGRGFLIGSALAYKLKCGLVPVRRKGKLKNDTFSASFIDYSNKEKTLEIHKNAFSENQNVILVDDWVETGSTLKAAISLIEKAGGSIVGVFALMDDSSENLKAYLKKYNYKYLSRMAPGDDF